jgi:hypothetical protein
MAEHQQPAGLAPGSTEQPLVVGVTADHPVQQDNVGSVDVFGLQRDVDEPAFNTTLHTGLLQQLRGLRLVVGGDLQVGRPRDATPEDLDLDLADTATDLQSSDFSASELAARLSP